jgi:hypothetical protein
MPQVVNLGLHHEQIRTSEDSRLTWGVGPCRRFPPVCCVGDDIHYMTGAEEIHRFFFLEEDCMTVLEGK